MGGSMDAIAAPLGSISSHGAVVFLVFLLRMGILSTIRVSVVVAVFSVPPTAASAPGTPVSAAPIRVSAAPIRILLRIGIISVLVNNSNNNKSKCKSKSVLNF